MYSYLKLYVHGAFEVLVVCSYYMCMVHLNITLDMYYLCSYMCMVHLKQSLHILY